MLAKKCEERVEEGLKAVERGEGQLQLYICIVHNESRDSAEKCITRMVYSVISEKSRAMWRWREKALREWEKNHGTKIRVDHQITTRMSLHRQKGVSWDGGSTYN